MISDTSNSEDLFICGKCHTNFIDLNIFLNHRSTCVNQQPTNLCPISSCPLTALLSADLETLGEDISSSLPPTSDTVYESNPSGTEINLLSPAPAEQPSTSDEIIHGNISDSTNYSSFNNGTSEINLHLCPVCDGQFESQSILEDHVFEHSTRTREDENISIKPGLSIDAISSSYIDVTDQTLECKRCAVTFPSNASLSIHKKMCKIILRSA